MSTATNYDELPYFCMARPSTHPLRLAGILHLLGIKAPPVNQCRVLELGCGDGTNLFSMAIGFPDSEFIGIDLSNEQINIGKKRLEKLNLPNVELYQADILTIGKEIGFFDYIIAHGVYSWVSETIQERILNLCSEHLTDNGSAYISYNTRPGWNLRMTVRDMLLYHTKGFQTIPEKIEHMKSWLQFVENHVSDKMAKILPTHSNYGYYRYLKNELPEFLELPESYLFHEFLEDNNAPIYFHEFMEKATQHNLVYAGDADVRFMFREFQTPEMLEMFGNLDTISKEQYVDFLENRQFRMSILCKKGVQIDPELPEKKLEDFYFSGSAITRSKNITFEEGIAIEFESAEIVFLEHSMLGKAALICLSEHYPETIDFKELLKFMQTLLAKHGFLQAIDKHEVIKLLLHFAVKGLIEALPLSLPITVEIEKHPKISPLARLELLEKKAEITSLRQDTTILNNPILTHFMPYLDGKHSRNDLIDILEMWAGEGKITPPSKELEITRELLEQLLDNLLKAIGKMGYLLKSKAFLNP